MTNAHTARDWVLKALSDEKAVARHFLAVSTNSVKVQEFGIDSANMYVRILGLGRWALFDGFGDRPFHDDLNRS